MKKILFHLFLLASLFMAACHDDNGGPSSIVIDKDQQNQTAYADDTEKTIRFEATEAWHTEVDYTATKATETVEKMGKSRSSQWRSRRNTINSPYPPIHRY